jgi:hypothetical protein
MLSQLRAEFKTLAAPVFLLLVFALVVVVTTIGTHLLARLVLFVWGNS